MTNTLPLNHTLLNEYTIEKVLGAGGFGVTYLARDTRLDTHVVIKEFFPSDMATRDATQIDVTPFTKDTTTYNHLLRRFSEEAQLLAGMRHPNVVKVIRFFNANNTAYFVMDFEEGKTLADYLKLHPTFSEEAILSIMIPILEGTKYVHSKGFLHRDIAPDNIYLTNESMPLLIDFGAARDAIAQESKNISSIVKEGYSSPEQYTINNQQGASSDIYALGAVFYRMITGKVPVSAPHRQTAILNDEPDPIGDLPHEYRSRYSPALLHTVAKAMNIRASDRFDSVAAFQEALMSGTVVNSTPSPRSGSYVAATGEAHHTKGKGVFATFVLFVVIFLLVIGGGVGYLYMEKVEKITTLKQQQAREKEANQKKAEALKKFKYLEAQIVIQKAEAEARRQEEIRIAKTKADQVKAEAAALKEKLRIAKEKDRLVESFDFSLHPGIGWRKNPYIGKGFNEKMSTFLGKTIYLSIAIPKNIYSDSLQERDSYGRISFTVQDNWDDSMDGGSEYLIHLMPNDSNPFVFMGDIAMMQGYYKIFDIDGPRQGYMSVNIRPAKNY